MRRRARVIVNEEDLFHLLALKPGEHVVQVWADHMMDSIVIGIEGDESTDLPEVAPGEMTPVVQRPYARIKFRERLRDLVTKHWQADQHDREAYLRALGEAVEREVFPELNLSMPQAES